MAQAGQLIEYQKQIQRQAIRRIKHPKPVAGIQNTRTPRTFYFDPSITVPYDLKDHRQRIIHKAGTTINPLSMQPLTKPLVFIDGESEKQVTWALTMPRAKIILVKGSAFELMERHPAVTVYFDQYGSIVKKLGIQQVPACVTQAEDRLKVEELQLTSNAKEAQSLEQAK